MSLSGNSSSGDRATIVAFVDSLEAPAREMLAAASEPDWHLSYPADDTVQAVASAVAGASAIVTRRRFVGPELLAAAGPDLRLVQIQGHLDTRVDLAAAHAAGVDVAVMPSHGCIAVAEHAMALMLALARRIVPGHAGVVDAKYSERGLAPAITTERSFAFNWLADTSIGELNGKTLGIVGFGEIGQEVARRAAAFNMTTQYWNRSRLAPNFEQQLGVIYVPLDTLIATSDFITLHLPHTAATERLIDASRLAAMKPTVRLINTSRGGIIDEIALEAALREGQIAGAGLDVFVEEPLPMAHPLTTLGNVVLTPHVGGGAGGGQRGHARDTLENVARALRGEPIRHLIAPSPMAPVSVEEFLDV
jgi:phosphoglycerate dehydrogenase-like enzyme